MPSDYRTAFFHATDDVQDKTLMLSALENFAHHHTISRGNREIVEKGYHILSSWFALQSVPPRKPASCTDDLAWETLRMVFQDPGYWLSHEELRCLAYCSSCRLSIHISQDAGMSATTEACMHEVGVPQESPTAHVMLRMGGSRGKRGHFVRLLDEAEWQLLQTRTSA